MKKKYLSIIIGCLVCAMLVVSVVIQNKTQVTADSKAKVEKVEKSVEIFIEVKGAVLNPGVYASSEDARVIDVIEIAGGLTTDANTDYINQAQLVKDQMLIRIMTNKEIDDAIQKEELAILKASEVKVANEQNEIIGYDDCYRSSKNSGGDSSLISLNDASMEQLMTLSGIGEKKASDIINYRNNNGGFNSIEELMEVNGIGESTFNKIKDSITL
ncbi:MAG: helix-hairpin-helix domain-containing protein [Bacilli bacterium]